jgi:hypothetical protein
VNTELERTWEGDFLELFDELLLRLSAGNKENQEKAREIRSTGGHFKPGPFSKETSKLHITCFQGAELFLRS